MRTPPSATRPPAAPIPHTSANAGSHRADTRDDFDGNGFADVIVSRTDGPPPIDLGDVYLSGAAGITSAPSQTLHAGGSCGLGSTAPVRIGDINDDGFGDLAVGAPGRLGAVNIFHGAATGFSQRPAATITAPGSTIGGCFGHALATGDVNGDDKIDLIVGAPQENEEAGKVFVFHGDGTAFEATPAAIIEGPEGAHGRFGSALDACDMNGDGRDDLLIGAPLVQDHRGRAYVWNVANHSELARLSAIDAVERPDHTYFEMGERVIALRSVRRCDAVFVANGVSHHGAYLLASEHMRSAPVALARPTNGAGITSMSAGDIDGDGHLDLVLAGEGLVRAHHGAENGLDQGIWFAIAPAETRFWGASAAIVGDMDGDGHGDVAVGDREHARIYFGTTEGVRADPIVLSPTLGSGMGRASWVR